MLFAIYSIIFFWQPTDRDQWMHTTHIRQTINNFRHGLRKLPTCQKKWVFSGKLLTNLLASKERNNPLCTEMSAIINLVMWGHKSRGANVDFRPSRYPPFINRIGFSGECAAFIWFGAVKYSLISSSSSFSSSRPVGSEIKKRRWRKLLQHCPTLRRYKLIANMTGLDHPP